MTEHELWNLAVDGMTERGRFKLANYAKHGYALEPKTGAVVLTRDDKTAEHQCLILLDDGRLFVGHSTIA